MENFATPYPVIFFDGEQEHDKGQVGIHSVFTFKRFKALISQKTGIPANQLSAVFVCRRTLRGTEKRQKLPINENTNFNIILNQHNPNKERDCHFLVSIKKSKKERKGSRKRGADSENPDDDEYISSRGDPSPLDERSKVNVAIEDGFTREVASPYSPIRHSLSPTLSPLSTTSGQSHTNVSPLDGVAEVAAAYGKIDRSSLLKRQVIGPNSFTMSRTGWNFGGVGPRLESVGASVAGKPDNSQGQGMTTFQLDDPRKLDRHWIRESFPTGQAEIGNGQSGLQAPQYFPFSQMEAFHPDRFSDGLSQGLGWRPRLGYHRNGALPAGILSFNRNPGTTPPTSRPSISSMASAGYFGSRVPLGFSDVAAMATKEADWQREHAHLYQLQQDRRFRTPLDLPNFTGGFPGFSAIGNGAEEQKTCAVCCDCKNRNIIPAPFHWCVQDKVTSGFRGPSPAGPIGRPVKRHIEAAA